VPKHFISFTATWFGFHDGNFAPQDMRDGRFYFGCLREHVMKESIPFEVTWRNEEKEHIFDPDRTVTLQDLDPEIAKIWQEFLKLLLKADKELRIRWGVCRDPQPITNYYEYGRFLQSVGQIAKEDIFPEKYGVLNVAIL
jgi:hypothetical protein